MDTKPQNTNVNVYLNDKKENSNSGGFFSILLRFILGVIGFALFLFALVIFLIIQTPKSRLMKNARKDITETQKDKFRREYEDLKNHKDKQYYPIDEKHMKKTVRKAFLQKKLLKSNIYERFPHEDFSSYSYKYGESSNPLIREIKKISREKFSEDYIKNQLNAKISEQLGYIRQDLFDADLKLQFYSDDTDDDLEIIEPLKRVQEAFDEIYKILGKKEVKKISESNSEKDKKKEVKKISESNSEEDKKAKYKKYKLLESHDDTKLFPLDDKYIDKTIEKSILQIELGIENYYYRFEAIDYYVYDFERLKVKAVKNSLLRNIVNRLGDTPDESDIKEILLTLKFIYEDVKNINSLIMFSPQRDKNLIKTSLRRVQNLFKDINTILDKQKDKKKTFDSEKKKTFTIDSEKQKSDLEKCIETFECDKYDKLKKCYRMQSLIHHPDKGGDAEMFKKLSTCNSEHFQKDDVYIDE